MSDQSNNQFDAELKGVPLPDGLLERLRKLADWDDALIDDALCSVNVPSSIIDRLHEAIDDEALDEAIGGVPLPHGLLARLRIIPHMRHRTKLSRLAVAASLFLLISSAYLSSLSALVLAIRPQRVEDVTIELPYDGPIQLVADFEHMEVSILPAIAPMDIAASRPENADVNVQFEDFVKEDEHGPVGELFVALKEGVDFEQDILLLKYQLLGARVVSDEDLPELVPTPAMPRPGIEPPLIRQYNRRFLLQNGIHPLVFPSANQALRTSSVPLSTDTSSFDLAVRGASNNQLPSPERVRVEDFVAAVGDHFPSASSDKVAIRVAAGPSVFGRELNPRLAGQVGWPAELARQQAGLLQVGAVAPCELRSTEQATHLTVALDTSLSMNWADRLDLTRWALANLLDSLGPDDRISLVAFNEQVVQQIEGAGPEDGDELLEALNRISARGGADLAAGLQHAVSVAMKTPWDNRSLRRVVVITDGRAGMSEESEQLIQQLLLEVRREGLRVSFFDLDGNQHFHSLLKDLAKAGGGELRRITTVDNLRWSLVEILSGSRPVVAEDTELTVTFRPEVVAAYRLLGHEAVSLAGLDTVSVSSPLRSGQSASTLFEVWLRPGNDDVVGRADVRWREAESGKSRHVRQRISRIQFAPSFAESSLSLQAAAIAAETAEVLRESPFVESRGKNLAHVLDVAENVNPRLAKSHAFQQFVNVVEQLEAIRLRNGGG